MCLRKISNIEIFCNEITLTMLLHKYIMQISDWIIGNNDIMYK